MLGMGNVLLGDDGIGPLVVETFRCGYDCGLGVEVTDLGTPGLDLSPYLHGKDLVLLIDAVKSDEPAGSVSTYGESDFAPTTDEHVRVSSRLTGHDPGLWESLAHLRLIACAPAELLIIGVVPASSNFGEPMSAAVLGALDSALRIIVQLLAARGVPCIPRVPPLQKHLWWMEHDLMTSPAATDRF